MGDEQKAAEDVIRELEELRRQTSALKALEVECRKAQESLMESEARFRMVFHRSPLGLVYFDQNGTVVECNDKFLEITGSRREALIGSSMIQFLREESMRSAVPAALAGDIGHREGDIVSVNGSRITSVRVTFSRIATESGRLLGGIGIFEDVTERKRAERELHESERFVRSALDSLRANIAILDSEGLILDTNESWRVFARYNGLPDYNFVGISYLSVCDRAKGMWSDEAPIAAAAIRDIIAGRRSGFALDYPCHSPDEKRWFHMQVTRFKDHEPVRVVVAHENITERKLAQEELRMLPSRLLSAQEEERKRIAGELHDGIGASLGIVKLSLENTLGQMQRGTATQESIKELISIVEQTSEGVREICMNLRPSVLDHLGITAAIGWFWRQFQSGHPEIRIEKHIEVAEEVIPEPIKIVIFRILQECFHNAAKHSKADSISLTLSEKDGLLHFIVADNGIGFDVEHVYEMRNGKAGLGLTSMRERVELSGGSFSVDSAIGRGTTIRATWEVKKQP